MKPTRRAPLPGQTAKSADDDPGTPARLAALLNARAIRQDPPMQRSCSETISAASGCNSISQAETLLIAAGVKHAIVVFGGSHRRARSRAASSAARRPPPSA